MKCSLHPTGTLNRHPFTQHRTLQQHIPQPHNLCGRSSHSTSLTSSARTTTRYGSHYTPLNPLVMCQAAAGAGGGDNNSNNHVYKTSEDPDDKPGAEAHLSGKWKLLLLAATAAAVSLVQESIHRPSPQTHPGKLSVIIPALNEEACISKAVEAAMNLNPPPHEVIVVDGGSTDQTSELARQAGASVLVSDRGRSKQMNRGAQQATGDYLAFLHADTLPPNDLVAISRQEFAMNPSLVLLGFTPIIRHNGHTLKFFTANNILKTYYGPILFQPWNFVRGLRCMFGDQLLCCRKSDFDSVSGYDESLPIMEDADLCVRLHKAGPAASAGQATRGLQKMLWNRAAVTSGRRLAAWGEVKATWIHVRISAAWLLGAQPQQLHHMYKTMYTDAFR